MSPLEELLKIIPPSLELEPWKRTPVLVTDLKSNQNWVVSAYNFLTVGYQGNDAPVVGSAPSKALLKLLNAPKLRPAVLKVEPLREWSGPAPTILPEFEPELVVENKALLVGVPVDRTKLSWLLNHLPSTYVHVFDTTKSLKFKSIGFEWYLERTLFRAVLAGIAEDELEGIPQYHEDIEEGILDLVMGLQ